MFDDNLEKIVDHLENRIEDVTDGDLIESISEEFDSTLHPQIGYRLGQKFLSINWKEDALPHFVHSSLFGLNPNNRYLQTGYADSIGQSMWYLLSKYDYKEAFEPYEYKIFCNAYIILTIPILAMGEAAFNSLNTRAKLIDGYKGSAKLKMLKKYYYNGPDLCEQMISFADYYRASIGFNKHGYDKSAQECKKSASLNKQKMTSLPQYLLMKNMSDEQMSKMSADNQDYLVKNLLKDYKNGAFAITESDFKLSIETHRKRKMGGIFGWF